MMMNPIHFTCEHEQASELASERTKVYVLDIWATFSCCCCLHICCMEQVDVAYVVQHTPVSARPLPKIAARILFV